MVIIYTPIIEYLVNWYENEPVPYCCCKLSVELDSDHLH